MSIANLLALAAAAASAIAGAGAAQTPRPPLSGSYSIVATPTDRVLTAVAPVDEADLAAFTGGQELVAVTNQNLTALNTGNSVNAASVVNGAVTLQANAFSGFSGLGNFVINTGNNNNLQGSMSINIIMAPAAP
jgi:hypothetical protein